MITCSPITRRRVPGCSFGRPNRGWVCNRTNAVIIRSNRRCAAVPDPGCVSHCLTPSRSSRARRVNRRRRGRTRTICGARVEAARSLFPSVASRQRSRHRRSSLLSPPLPQLRRGRVPPKPAELCARLRSRPVREPEVPVCPWPNHSYWRRLGRGAEPSHCDPNITGPCEQPIATRRLPSSFPEPDSTTLATSLGIQPPGGVWGVRSTCCICATSQLFIGNR